MDLGDAGARAKFVLQDRDASFTRRDPLVAAWSGVSFADAQIDGQTVPVLVSSTRARVTPPILSGRPVDADNRIVLSSPAQREHHAVPGTPPADRGNVPPDQHAGRADAAAGPAGAAQGVNDFGVGCDAAAAPPAADHHPTLAA